MARHLVCFEPALQHDVSRAVHLAGKVGGELAKIHELPEVLDTVRFDAPAEPARLPLAEHLCKISVAESLVTILKDDEMFVEPGGLFPLLLFLSRVAKAQHADGHDIV